MARRAAVALSASERSRAATQGDVQRDEIVGLRGAIVMSDAQLRVLIEGDTGLLDPAALDWRLAPFMSHFRID